MYAVSTPTSKYEITSEKEVITVDNEIFDWDVQKISDNEFHIIKNHQSYRCELIAVEAEEKKVILKINNKVAEFKVKDKFDLLLEKLGMSSLASTQLKDIKAPMPGLILDIKVKVGDEVKKGEPILILEAMKMENLLKSPGDGTISAIKVKKGDSVEKNQVMILF
ncbi:acetyl-CoA carboxylase biotin carboxyl carrier protein subunit [Penaeicola halotolerans]|uniref:acetyl-CoA carboxylase biotin carboxyl carrier protein subunit n=1 Tax=Penaeicola halotolerans TaxID=2793196 RepID=UPI001CF8D55B|nr:acetyl-CoA carboxylase biotin carboxyl carrier protein subunit [Penaeicola halotolerans]